MDTMKNYPSILRTEYALALLSDRDENKAAQVLSRFKKIASTYPYPNDIQSEHELMLIAADQKNSL